MFNPTVVFAFIVATIYGIVFHLLVGGDVRRLALYLLAGWLGFALGHLLGTLADIHLFQVGTLRIFTATVGAWTALIAAWLFSRRPQQQGERRVGRLPRRG